jgi:hypothetical protein
VCKELTTLANRIWDAVSENSRAQSATTIAIILAGDGSLYCTANDVSSISKKAEDLAIVNKVMPISGSYISCAGVGFHAEMWAVQNALTVSESISEVIRKIGSSRPCCKYCTAVLTLKGVAIEESSDTLYSSWINPLTSNDEGNPRKDFAKEQRQDIPDFRRNGKDYWWTDTKGNWTNEQRGIEN